MKIIVLILGFVFTLPSFVLGQSEKENLNIPDKIVIKKSSKYLQFPGTRVFILNPKGYILISSLIRFQKDNDTYIQAAEFPTISYLKQKASIQKSFEETKTKGLKSYYQKEFKLGDYDAFLVYGADNKPNLDQMVLVFGDNDFIVLVSCEMPANNELARKEILSALLSTYLDKTVKPDYSALVNFTIDVSKSNFKFNCHASQNFYYTINGLGDPVNNPFENQIIVSTLPSMKNTQERKEYALSMIQEYEKFGLTIPSFNQQEIIINGASAYEITFSGIYKGKSSKVYQIVLGDDKATILFCASAYDRQDELMKQFKNIAKSLKIK
ncbi:MAG: hypothetical protein WCQ95_10800 [Bacteroidota bacterium]